MPDNIFPIEGESTQRHGGIVRVASEPAPFIVLTSRNGAMVGGCSDLAEAIRDAKGAATIGDDAIIYQAVRRVTAKVETTVEDYKAPNGSAA